MSLGSLKPSRDQRIVDAVAEAGIDVDPWARKRDGSPVQHPAANPKYCYEWAFGGGAEPTALCVWHENLRADGEIIYYADNVQEVARRLEAVAAEWHTSQEVANRSNTQAKRAWEFDRKIQHAYRTGQLVRLILLAGRQRDRTQLGIDSSEVEFRQLDAAQWRVESYEPTGSFRIVREPFAHDVSNVDYAYEQVARVSVEKFADAFAEIDAQMTGAQREMLVGHAMAPNRTLSMESVAALGGYDGYATANLQYGRLGGMIADALGISGLANKVQAICELSEVSDDHGHAQWIIRKPVFDALVTLEIVSATPSDAESDDVLTMSLMASPDIADETPTTRKALVDARLGQGAYRRKMLRWWGGACAVTGCTVEEALVASHAVPWRGCSSRERLDHFNGLLLTGTLDRLFDAGLIGFSQDGVLVISPKLSEHDWVSLGLSDGMRLRKLTDRLTPYLERHRILHGLLDLRA